jgi:hypothetical protein
MGQVVSEYKNQKFRETSKSVKYVNPWDGGFVGFPSEAVSFVTIRDVAVCPWLLQLGALSATWRCLA